MRNTIRNKIYEIDYPLYVNSEMEKLFKKYFLKEVADVHRGRFGNNRKIHGIRQNEK
jgi:hypothetical protein